MASKVTADSDRREVVLLLPAMTTNRTLFPNLDLPTLDLDFSAAAPDAIRPGRPHSMDDYAAALDRFLATSAARWDCPVRVVVAHSFGGALALWWLTTRTGTPAARISGLVLVSTSAGPFFDVVRLRLGHVLDTEWRVPFKPLLPLWNRGMVTRAVKRLTSGGHLDGIPQDFARLRRPSDFRIDLAGWRNTEWHAMRAFRSALDGFDARDRLSGIRVPTIVLHGTRDAVLPLGTARALAAGIAGAELRVVDGAGHGLPLTHGDVVVRAVRELRDRAPS